MKAKESEFGEGCAYCLGLFLAHEHLYRDWSPHMWFNGASDHLYDMHAPPRASRKLKDKIRAFRRICIEWGHGLSYLDGMKKVTARDKEWALDQARSLLRELDQLMKVKVKKGQWE